ncbi:MAG: hypothetical protein WBM87_02175 [Woeseiaceae bacterium]
MQSRTEIAALLFSALALSACGGGSTPSGPNTTPNRVPTANAGPDQEVAETLIVSLDGSDSRDMDGDFLTYAWVQTAGPDVILTDASLAQPSFTSPDVAAGSPEVLSFRLTVSDGAASSSDTVDITVREPQNTVTISGQLFYEFVPPIVRANQCDRLDFSSTVERPIRQATVQLLDVDGNVLATTLASNDGSYSFSGIDAGIDVRVSVRAELMSAGPAAWDVEIRDNVDDPQNPLPLKERPVYVVQWQLFDTGIADTSNADFTARTGWSGSAYTGVRAAAPFAILDAIYSAIELVIAVDPVAIFLPLDAFWSVNNKKVPDNPNIDIGELTSAFYRSDLDALFLFGDESTETDEFDDHLVLHEWTHHFDDTFSRSDSIGGSHYLGESLDLRLAFGEGFAHALAAIALAEPQYCDTGAVPSGHGSFGFNMETNNSGLQGWFNELSVATFIYDLWDTGSDGGADDRSIGFKPIYDTMKGPQKETPAFTTLFSFAAELRAMPALSDTDRAFVDAQLNRENVDTPVVDIWGGGQTTTPPDARNSGRDLTPIYTEIPTDGSIANVCINNDYVVDGVVNKLSDWRYLRFELPTAGRWRITARANPVPRPTEDLPRPPPDNPDAPPETPRDRSDPDLYIWRNGVFITSGRSGADDVEVLDHTFEAGTYVVEMQEWRHEDEGADSVFPGASSDFPRQVCFDLSMVAL